MQPQTLTVDVSEYHPFRRFFARIFDCFIIAFAVLFCVMFPMRDFVFTVAEAQGPEGLQKLNMTLAIVLWVILLLYETILLSRWGTTLGKWMFGMKVYSTEASLHPGLRDSLCRTILVHVIGLGLGIPIVSEVLMIFWAITCKKLLPWEKISHTHLSYNPVKVWAIVLFCFFFLAMFPMLSWGVASLL